MDIIVIQYPDGTLKSTPFHVKFGSFKIMRTKEKIVELYVNGNKTDILMKISSSGDVYFPDKDAQNVIIFKLGTKRN